MDEHDHNEKPSTATNQDRGPEAPAAAGLPSPPAGDQASRSLADALRVSFRVLTLIMVLVAGAFVISGFARIRPYQRGVERIFGRIIGEADEGLAYNWPFPVGSIETVSTGSREITIDDFWFNEKPEEQTVSLDRRRAPRGGLRPGWDGALLTGDRNLIHMKLTCFYEVEDATKYLTVVRDDEEMIRSVVCSAAIRAAARETADGLIRSGRIAEFTQEVQRLAQEGLEKLDSGMVITRIQSGQATWPLRARAAYNGYAQAVADKRKAVQDALGQAQDLLRNAAGRASDRLVGTLAQVRAGLVQSALERERLLRERDEARAAAEQADQPQEKLALAARATALQARCDELGETLIGQYMLARERQMVHEAAAGAAEAAARGAGDAAARRLLAERARHEAAAVEQHARSERTLAEIDAVLVKGATTGEASRIVSRGSAYREAVKERVRGWANEFEKLLPECRTPEATAFFFERKWADLLDALLESQLVEKHVLPARSGQKLILRISADPGIRKRIRLEEARAPDQDAAGRTGQQP
jgi:regulator of protease activity HflC (stomatin/prohibitin superfamily)